MIGPIAAGVPETWQVRTPEMPAFFSNLNSKAVSVSLFMRETSHAPCRCVASTHTSKGS